MISSSALVACTNEEETPPGGATVVATPHIVDDEGRFFTIDEIRFGSEGSVRLTNFTEEPGSLTGLFLCQPPECLSLPDVEVAPGASSVVAVGDGAGMRDVVMTGAALQLPPAGGEVALYASTDVGQPDDLRAYVEWGSTPHEGTLVAVESGLWPEGAVVTSVDDATRIYLSRRGVWRFDTG